MRHACATARLLPVLLGALCALALVAPATAWSHAVLTSTDPGNEATLEQAPDRVTLTFTERVSVAFGGVQAYGPDGARVEGRAVARGSRVEVPVEDGGEGTYAVSWRVVSADGHPVRGAFVYHVGEASDTDVSRVAAEAASEVSRPAQVAYGVARFVVLAGLLVAVGGVVFGLLFAPGWPVRWIVPALVAVLLGSVASFFLDAMVAGGFGIADAFRASVVEEEAGTTAGRAAVLRVVVAVLCLVLWRLRSRRGMTAPLLLSFGVLALTLSIGGHASAEEPVWLRVSADLLHVLAACVWFGGLLQLWSMLRADEPADVDGEVRIVRRFSAAAGASVAVLVLTGLYASYEEIGLSADALLETTYGRLVLGKWVLFLLVLPLAAVNRQRTVPALGAMQGDDHRTVRRRLRSFVRAEAAIVVVVLALTAWLIATPPAKDSLAPQLVDRTLQLAGGGTVQVTLDPAGTGTNLMHVYVFEESGQPARRTSAVQVQLLKDTGERIGPLTTELDNAGPGHFQATRLTIPQPGTWKVTVLVRTGEFDEQRRSFRAEVRRAPGAS